MVPPTLAQIEAYYDAVPRRHARTETVGPFTLFIRTGPGHPYYARPTPGSEVFSVDDVLRARARQRACGVPEAFEWVDDVTPGLTVVAPTAGLEVLHAPLMLLGDPLPAAPPAGTSVRLLRADEAGLASAVAHVAFASPGTAIGAAGVEAARAAADPTARPGGDTVTYGAFDGDDLVAVGSHLPLGEVTEVVGVGTLPTHRRRGLGAAVTAALVADARAAGVGLVFLSAGSDAIAAVYARLGFRRIATACIAAPA
jgi:GNAT superfamily N-acetyltransferase